MRGHLQNRGGDAWRLKVYVGRSADGRKRYVERTVRGTRRVGGDDANLCARPQRCALARCSGQQFRLCGLELLGGQVALVVEADELGDLLRQCGL